MPPVLQWGLDDFVIDSVDLCENLDRPVAGPWRLKSGGATLFDKERGGVVSVIWRVRRSLLTFC